MESLNVNPWDNLEGWSDYFWSGGITSFGIFGVEGKRLNFNQNTEAEVHMSIFRTVIPMYFLWHVETFFGMYVRNRLLDGGDALVST